VTQCEPLKGGDFNELFDFLNIKSEKDKCLFSVTLVSYFNPEIPRPIMVCHGIQGAAKTVTMEIAKSLVDPGKVGVCMLRTKDMIQVLSANYFTAYDNITSISQDTSDRFCSAVTGVGNFDRKLYTNDELHLYSFKRCIALNGINCVVEKPDLLDRSILIELERIPEEKRVPLTGKNGLWAKFNERKPYILGAIFDVLARAQQRLPLELDRLPRLADFAELGVAVAEELGYEKDFFLDAYMEHIDNHNEIVVDSDPVSHALILFMQDKPSWEGTTTALRSKLKAIAENEMDLNISSKFSGWQQHPSAFKRKIKAVSHNLSGVGIKISDGKRSALGRSVIVENQNYKDDPKQSQAILDDMCNDEL
jgi:hypothetical protein